MLEYFLNNALSLIGLIALAYLMYHTGRGAFQKHPRLARVFFGIFAGLAGAFLMSQSFETESGVLIGYRNLNIGIAALFGGFFPAAIAAGIMFAYRVLAIGLNQTTLTLLASLTVLTISGTLLARYVKPLARQWAAFCTLNIAVTAIALYSLLRGKGNPPEVFIIFFVGYVLLSFIIYIILKLFLQFDRNYSKLEGENVLNTHDPLTGLKNRNAVRLLKENLKERDGLSGIRSVMTVDIDNFRLVNNALGHLEGDRMILDLSRKLTAVMEGRGEVYHTDGDEFLVLVESADPSQMQEYAREILRILTSQIMVSNRLFFLTASIGIAMGKEGEALDQAIENADTALYIAKKEKNAAVLYTREMEKARTRDSIMEEDLRSALEKKELELYFQPIYDVRKGCINQVEALLRWNHPEFGRVSPIEFIPIAERTKLILPITDWVIRESCHQLARWKDLGIEGVIVSVNLSFVSFENRGDELTSFVARSIKEAGIEPSSLKLEITESVLMHDSDETIKVFHEMKRIGVKLALDDFGTGYSTFEYMKELPLDIMKLDRSLIRDLIKSEKEQMIVSTIITIIHALGLEVVVEGVETQEQYDLLKEYGADYIQGFLFSKPLPAADFVAYYRSMDKQVC